MKRAIIPAALAALAIGVAGCGGGTSSSAEQKAAISARTSDMALAMNDIIILCGNVGSAAATATRGNPVDTIIRIAKDHPDFVYDGRTMKQVLADESVYIQGCSPEAARKFDAARLAMP